MQTPYYLYDAGIIKDRARELVDAFKGQNVRLHYAVKANDNPALIKLIAGHGLGACLVSAGEMKRALRAGIKPEAMLMNGVGKSAEDIRFVLQNGIGQLNVESLPELSLVADIAKELDKRACIGLRVNPEIEAKAYSHNTTARRTDKFGTLIEDIGKAAAIVDTHPELDWRGFSCHIGSQIHGMNELAAGYATMAKLFAEWRQKQPQFDRLDLGGGFGVSYTGEAYARPADYAKLLGETCGDLMKEGVTIQLEPGRFLVAESGTLVTKIIRVKDSGETRFVIVDSAMNDLVRPAMYGAFHPIALARASQAPLRPCTIAGPVCESGDVFGTERPLPEDVKEGDILHIGIAGAYGYVMSSHYNARSLLPEYLREASETKCIRRGFSAEELDALTCI